MARRRRNPKGSKKNTKNRKNRGRRDPGAEKLDKAIVAFVRTKRGDGIKTNRVFSKFLKTHSKAQVEGALQRLERSGQLESMGKGFVRATGARPGGGDGIITGLVDMTRSGSAYIITDHEDPDVYVPQSRVGTALHNDRVRVRITRAGGAKPRGEIIEVVTRNQTEFIGVYSAQGDFGFVKEVHTDHFPFDFFIPPGKHKGATDGDTVLIHVTEWQTGKGKSPAAEVRELLSDLSDNDVEMRAILLENGFNPFFPAEVIQQTEDIPETVPAGEIEKRLDYRDVLTFTIDPEDAKDFDDALSVKPLDNGRFEVGVHIADVSHYVQPGTPLDEEARQRGTSVYLPDRVCPMLPEKLSNGVCSLRPNEEKLAFSVLFTVSAKRTIESYTFARTVIESDTRFAYQDAQDVIDGRSDTHKDAILLLADIARRLRRKRFKNGAIAFEMPEVRFELDDEAHPIDLYVKERQEAHMLVEDFMLLANMTVAKFVGTTPRAMVYRVHDQPDMERLQQLSNVARRFGHDIRFRDQAQARDVLNRLMEYVQGRPEAQVLQQLAVRSMSKAVYTTKNIGHYGLGAEYYTHFTSPIRRYPDVLVHRILWEHMEKENPIVQRDELEELCEMSSVMERKAQLADRDATKYKQVEYLADRLGEEYDGVITGVIARGIFVQMTANHCEGHCSVDNFSERFHFDEEKLQLRGERSGRTFAFGAPVRVRIVSADPKDRKVDLEVVDG